MTSLKNELRSAQCKRQLRQRFPGTGRPCRRAL